MSQQSIQIDSFEHAGPRYADSSTVKVDVLTPKRHPSLVAVAYPIKRELSADNSVAFGGEVKFTLPNSGYLHRVDIKFTLGTSTTVDYVDYPAASIIKQVTIKSDNEDVHKYDYKPVFQYYLSKLKSEEAIDKVLLAAGSTGVIGSSAGGTCLAPIPMFCDYVVAPGARPWNLSRMKKAPEIIVELESAANSVKPTGTVGTITAVIVVYLSETTNVLKKVHQSDAAAFHKSIDFYTNVKNSVATATATDIDISGVKGQIKRIHLNSRTVTDVDTNKQYYSNNEVDQIKTIIDGHEEYVIKHKEEGERDYIFYNHGRGYSSTLGYPYIIPYAYIGSTNYATSNVGGIHSGRLHKNEIRVQHSNGANEYIDILGIRSAIFKYSNGQLLRLL